MAIGHPAADHSLEGTMVRLLLLTQVVSHVCYLCGTFLVQLTKVLANHVAWIAVIAAVCRRRTVHRPLTQPVPGK